MSIRMEIKNKIIDVIDKDLRALYIIGKIGNNSSVEIFKIIKELDDTYNQLDLYFSYHHSFEKESEYLTKIYHDIESQYYKQRDLIDPDSLLLEAFNDEKFINKIERDPVNEFNKFISNLTEKLGPFIRNIIFLIDPHKISSAIFFNEMLENIISNSPTSVKFVVCEDIESSKHITIIGKRLDIIEYKLPSTPKEVINYIEDLINNKKADLSQIAGYHQLLGDLYDLIQNNEKSESEYLESFNIYLDGKYYSQACQVLIKQALNYYAANKFDPALQKYEDICTVAEENNLKDIAIFCRTQQAKIHLKLKNIAKAEVSCNKALNLCEDKKDLISKANVLSTIGDIFVDSNNIKKAITYYHNAILIEKESNHSYGHARDLLKLSKLYLINGKNIESEKYKQLSTEIQEKYKFSLEHESSK